MSRSRVQVRLEAENRAAEQLRTVKQELRPGGTYVWGYEAGFGSGYRHRRWRQIAAGVALGIVTGLMVGNLITKAATPRSAPTSTGQHWPAVVGQTGAPQLLTAANGTAVGPSPRAAASGGRTAGGAPPHLIAPACSPDPCPTLKPLQHPPSAVVVRGIMTWYSANERDVAWPDGPGWKLRLCGAAACRTVVSTDAGPSLAGQRAGRVIDVGWPLFEEISGLPRRYGVAEVTVVVLGR